MAIPVGVLYDYAPLVGRGLHGGWDYILFR